VGEQFDPAWEYWQPDPDIAEAMGCERLGTFADLGLEEEEQRGVWHKRENVGFRFGRGNPDWFFVKFAPAKRERVYETKPKPRYECQQCGAGFDGSRGRRVYCRECVPDRGKPLIGARTCRGCSAEFYPIQRRYAKFCSPRCGGASVAKAYHAAGCPVCGAEVVRSGKGRSAAKVYCSRKCKGAAMNREYRKRKAVVA